MPICHDECSPGEQLAALMHQDDPSGVYQPCRVGMMHEWRVDAPGLHSCIMTTNVQSALKHYASLKGLYTQISTARFQMPVCFYLIHYLVYVPFIHSTFLLHSVILGASTV